MNKVKVKLSGNMLLVALIAAGTVAPASAGSVTNDVIFGTGNVNSNWTTNTSGNVEVGLRAKDRVSGDFNQVGNMYTQQAGTGTNGALWNFEWSVNLATSGPCSTGSCSGPISPWLNYVSVLTIETDTGTGLSPVSLPTALAGLNWYGDNNTGNGGGTQKTILGAILDGDNLEQNSLNIGQLPAELLGYDPNLTGNYLMELSVYELNLFPGAVGDLASNGWMSKGIKDFDHSGLTSLLNNVLGDEIVSTNIQVKVVPIPAAAWLFGSALVGLVGITRRRQQA